MLKEHQANEIIDSKRFFQLWRYSVGHSQLLLRSTKSEDCPTRIDVFFKGVKEFHLPTSFDGLSIADVSNEEVRRLQAFKPSLKTGYYYRFYKVKSVDFAGYIVALVVGCHEDNGEYYEPGFFDYSNPPSA
jgi:hypothetical protein